MKTLTIKCIPNSLCDRLEGVAEKNKRTLNEEVVAILSSISDSNLKRKPRVKGIVESVEKFRVGLKRPLSPEGIREAIEEGRD